MSRTEGTDGRKFAFCFIFCLYVGGQEPAAGQASYEQQEQVNSCSSISEF